jgi:hypothetical protein
MPSYPEIRPADASASPSLRAPLTGLPSKVVELDDRDRALIVRGLSRRVHGVFASMKNRRSMPWSTREQRDLMCLLEVDPAILSYEAWPEQVSYVLDGRQERRTPACRARLRQGDAVFDAFPTSGAGTETRLRVVAALAGAYADRGIPYRALTGAEIRTEPRFSNATWILSRRGYEPTEREVLLVTGELSLGGRPSVAEIAARLPGVADVGSVLAWMVLRRHVAMNLSAAEPSGMTARLHGEGFR